MRPLFIRRCLGLAAAALLPTLAAAQHALAGPWRLSFSTGDDEPRQAQLSITGNQGSWTTEPRAGREKRDPYVGRPFPLTVQANEAERVVIAAAFAAQVGGCKDRVFTGRWVDAGTLEGKLDNGRPARLTRP